ncbi:MAG: hypothetical protein V1717_01215 [Candidatus Micrarchaeota archaeon]
MKKLFFAVLAFSLVFLAGCLQEKQLDLSGLPTIQATATGLVTGPLLQPSPTIRTTPSATATPSATPSPTPTAAGSCEILTPGTATFASPATVQLLIPFADLPESVVTASIKCDDGEAAIDVGITRAKSVFARRACIYSPSSSRSYKISVTAGATSCSKIIFVSAG